MPHDAADAGSPMTPAAIRRPDVMDFPGDQGLASIPGRCRPMQSPASRWQRRRITAAATVALAVSTVVLLLGVALDRGPSGRWQLGRRTGDFGVGGPSRLALLQEVLDEDADDMLRDDMLASAPAPTQALSWLDWSEDDIEREETIIKQKLVNIEQNLIAQPQKLNEMKVALGKVEEYYGKNGKLRQGVPEALTSVRKQMQQAEDEVMQSERMRRLTADIRAIRTGAKMFLSAQKAKDTAQDGLLHWTKQAQREFMGTSYQHFKTLKRHLRGDERDVERVRQDVRNFQGENRRRISRAMRRKKDDLKAKGKELMIRFFGEGSKRMRRKTRGRKRKDGLWDAIEDEANANVSKGLEDAFVKWDAAAWQTRIGLRDIQDVVDELEPAMDAWHRNASWRLGNLSRAFIDFRHLNGNLTLPLSALGRNQTREIKILQDAIDDMAERRAVAMDPCIGARETAQALTVLIAMLTTRAQTAAFDDLQGQERLDAVRSAFYKLESRRLSDEEKKKILGVIVGEATEKNSTSYEVEHMTEQEFRDAMERIAREQKGVMDERALILTILKLLSQRDYSAAEEKMGQLSQLHQVGGVLSLLAQGSLAPRQERGRHVSLEEGGEGEDGDEQPDADIYTKVNGRYKYGVDLRDSEEIRVVKGIMLKILLQLDDQEDNLQKQEHLWNKILLEKHAARVKWEDALLDSMHKVTNLSTSLDDLAVRTVVAKSEFDFRKDSFNETHSAFVVEAKLLDEEIAMLRRALARAEQKVQACDLERELNGGDETPHAVEASAKAAAAWKVLLGRLVKHNSTAKFLHRVEPPSAPSDPGADNGAGGARAVPPAAEAGYARLAGAQAEPAAQAKDKVLQSLNEALRKLKADEDAEERLHKMVADGRDRLGRLHRELAQAAMVEQLAAGRPSRDFRMHPHQRGRGADDESYEVHRFDSAARAPVHAYKHALSTLDGKIALLKRLAKHKIAASLYRSVATPPGDSWGHARWVPVGADAERSR